MIDHFAIGLTHALMALAIWRLLMRDDLDVDGAAPSSPAQSPLRPRRQEPVAEILPEEPRNRRASDRSDTNA